MLQRILGVFRRHSRNRLRRWIGLTKIVTSDVELALPPGEFLELIERQVEAAPLLELSEYRALIKGVPPPTNDQVGRFTAFVSNAKSWYKHLPPFGPGTPFHFFIDPCAGSDRTWASDGTVAVTQRTPSSASPRFHYTWMTTEDYLARFGQLSFSCEAGSRLLLVVSGSQGNPGSGGLLDTNWSHPIVYSDRGELFRVPNAVLEAGRVDVPGVIHSLAGSLWFWDTLSPKSAGDWGEASDIQTVERVRERCRAARERQSGETDAFAIGPDPEIENLLAPVRERIKMQMAAAIRRMRDLVYSA